MALWETQDTDTWIDFDAATHLRATEVSPSLGVGGRRAARYWLHPNGWTDVEFSFRWGIGASKGRGFWQFLLPDGLRADHRTWTGTEDDDNWRIMKGSAVLGRSIPVPVGQHKGLTVHLYDGRQDRVGFVVEGGMFMAHAHPFAATEALGNLHVNFSFVRQAA